MKLKSSQRKSIATVPSSFSGQERRYAQSVSEAVDTLSGRRGNIIDRAVTFRDLLDTGVLRMAGGILGGGGVDVINPNDPNGPDSGPTELPTQPSNLVATGGFLSIFLEWDLPPYNGHDYIEIFRFASDNLVAAESAGAYTRYYGDLYFYVDPNVGSDETWYYWVRAVNRDGVAGPFNSSSGTPATSAIDYEFVSGLIDESLSEAGQALGLNDTIDALENFTGYSSSYNGDSLVVRMGDVETVAGNAATSAQLQSESITRANADSALSAQISTLTSTVGSNTTSIQTNVSTINGIQGKFAVKIDNNGHVSGFGLISQDNDHSAGFVVQPTSAFIINADRFAVAAPYDATSTENSNVGTNYPFKVLTTAQTINGVSVPAGVYIDDAFIHDAQITNALIKDATITSAKITELTASKISSGTITIDNSNDIAIRQGKSSYYGTANGFWLGRLNGSAAFNLGNNTNYVKFNGSTLEITGASINTASIGTLQLAGNAVTVPIGFSNQSMNTLITTSTTNWTVIGTSPQLTWNSVSERPSAVIINACLNFLAQNSGSAQQGLYIRVRVIGPSNNFVPQTVGVSKGATGLSGFCAVNAFVDMSGRTSPHTFQLEARTTTSNYIVGGNGLAVLAAKR